MPGITKNNPLKQNTKAGNKHGNKSWTMPKPLQYRHQFSSFIEQIIGSRGINLF